MKSWFELEHVFVIINVRSFMEGSSIGDRESRGFAEISQYLRRRLDHSITFSMASDRKLFEFMFPYHHKAEMTDLQGIERVADGTGFKSDA
jgi:hypothetical protein